MTTPITDSKFSKRKNEENRTYIVMGVPIQDLNIS